MARSLSLVEELQTATFELEVGRRKPSWGSKIARNLARASQIACQLYPDSFVGP